MDNGPRLDVEVSDEVATSPLTLQALETAVMGSTYFTPVAVLPQEGVPMSET